MILFAIYYTLPTPLALLFAIAAAVAYLIIKNVKRKK